MIQTSFTFEQQKRLHFLPPNFHITVLTQYLFRSGDSSLSPKAMYATCLSEKLLQVAPQIAKPHVCLGTDLDIESILNDVVCNSGPHAIPSATEDATFIDNSSTQAFNRQVPHPSKYITQ
jgi:hypothetical protein